nr:MAG TPA: hypothetical protein [Caudoviricetes sp.]
MPGLGKNCPVFSFSYPVTSKTFLRVQIVLYKVFKSFLDNLST